MRGRFLGLIDETLQRYDFDGVELDWMRGPPFFKPGQVLDHTETLTGFMAAVQGTVRRRAEQRGKDITLITRVAPSLDEGREIGIDGRTWIRDGLADLFVLSSGARRCRAS